MHSSSARAFAQVKNLPHAPMYGHRGVRRPHPERQVMPVQKSRTI
ncbi:hypothetical protein ASZ90_009331 [hydrocarbon metagenome]|uniref:Uncharacterized protein n=1 Tax=hydrocarbon metagenome TaxID=938273 RepID=A0A0W8FJ66_9ZZZZ